jgi:hypothetical protein
MERKEAKEPEDIAPEPTPQITPEMVRDALKTLESRGLIHFAEAKAYIPTERGWRFLTKAAPEKEEIIAYGHQNITATHTKTIEVTKAKKITRDADCIIGVKANKACADLSDEFKSWLRRSKKIKITIEAEGVEDKIIAYGSPALKLTHEEDIVIRKSDFIDNRTLAILANKAANELNQDLINKLKNPETEIKITLETK